MALATAGIIWMAVSIRARSRRSGRQLQKLCKDVFGMFQSAPAPVGAGDRH